VPSGDRERVRETRVFVSRDEGRTWELAVTAPPDRPDQTYTFPADGVYWFYPVKVFKDGTQDPPAAAFPPEPGKVRIKLLVDTTPPVVRITGVERAGFSAGAGFRKKLIRVDWEADDENLDDRKTAVEYRPAGADGKWNRVPVAEGMAHVMFDDPGGPVEVRVSATDRAGNVGVSAVKRVE
jgi:hypothetical protein